MNEAEYHEELWRSRRVLSVEAVSRNKPWLSYALIKCIKKKSRLYKKYLQNPTMDRQSVYKTTN